MSISPQSSRCKLQIHSAIVEDSPQTNKESDDTKPAVIDDKILLELAVEPANVPEISQSQSGHSSLQSSKTIKSAASIYKGSDVCSRSVLHINQQMLQRKVSTKQRKSLAEKSLFTRLAHHPILRQIYLTCARCISLSDQASDVLIFISLVRKHGIGFHEWTYATTYALFLLLPYFVMSLLILPAIMRRAAIQLSLLKTKILVFICLPFYVIIMMISLPLLDLYICFYLMFIDLATTRYYLYYWRLKTLVEILFETLPQTLFLSTTHLLQSESTYLILFSLGASIGLLIWQFIKIFRGGHQTSLGFAGYLKKYYIEQGMEMIPYLDAIVQNNLIQLRIIEKFATYEWTLIARAIFFNYSIQHLALIKQSAIIPKVWCLILSGLGNNRLIALKLIDCGLFSPHHDKDFGIMRKRSISVSKSQSDIENVVSLSYASKTQHSTVDIVSTNTKQKTRSSFAKNIQDIFSVNSTIIKDENCVFKSPELHRSNNNSTQDSTVSANFDVNSVVFCLQHAIKTSKHSLIVLNLAGNALFQCFEDVCGAILRCTEIQDIDLSNNHLHLVHIESFQDNIELLLMQLKSLKVIALCDNRLDDTKVAVLSKCMESIANYNANVTTGASSVRDWNHHHSRSPENESGGSHTPSRSSNQLRSAKLVLPSSDLELNINSLGCSTQNFECKLDVDDAGTPVPRSSASSSHNFIPESFHSLKRKLTSKIVVDRYELQCIRLSQNLMTVATAQQLLPLAIQSHIDVDLENNNIKTAEWQTILARSFLKDHLT